MNRRILAILLALVMVAGLMTGCASGKQEAAAPETAQTESPTAEDTAAEREETSETAMQLKRLTEALPELNTAERQLLQALYFEGIPAREYARQLGVYHRTVLYRRDQLLEKLRRMIFA